MADWKFVSQRRNGAQVAELVDLTSVSMSFFLNRPATLSADLRIESSGAAPDAVAPGQTEVVAYRDGDRLPEAFRVSALGVSRGGASTRVQVRGDGWLSYLQDLLVLQGGGYNSTAQSSIVWGWVDTAQTRSGGDYGLEQGTVPTSDPTKSVTIEQDTELLEAIVQLSERSDGFDFDVDAGRRVNVHYPSRGSDRGVVFDSDINVVAFSVDEDAGPGAVVNHARVRGGPGSTVQVADDADARDLYGRREGSVQYSGVISDDTALLAHADRLVADRAVPLLVPSLTIDDQHPSNPWGSYWLGDTVTVRLRAGSLVQLDAQYRIVAVHVQIDGADNERIRIELNPV